MTSSTSQLLTDHDLPFVELQAAALDGELFRLDRAFCSIAEFDVPWRRAGALAPLFGSEYVVARTSAAWVWGGLADAPHTHEGFLVGAGRHRDSPVGMRASDVRLPDDDIVDFGPVRVSSPVRTIVDLARGDSWGLSLASATRSIASEHRVTRAQCTAILTRGKNLPHSRRARARLDEVFSDTFSVSSG